MKLLLDQGLPRSSARWLNEVGWDAVHVADIGMSRAEDRDILRRAVADDRVCVTLDADFHALLATGGAYRPSVIRIREEGLDGFAIAALLQSIWPGIGAALENGAMVTVTGYPVTGPRRRRTSPPQGNSRSSVSAGVAPEARPTIRAPRSSIPAFRRGAARIAV